MAEKTIGVLVDLGIAVAIFLIGLVVIKIILVICRRALKKTSLDPALHKFVTTIIKIVLLIILIIIILGRYKVSPAPFVTVLGAAGAAIALALKDSLGNVAGGLIILMTKPFGQGDYIDIIETEGAVQSIDLLTTTLKTLDNKVVTIPNGKVSTSVLTNYSRQNERRVDCTFGIGYNDDIQKAKEIMLEVAFASGMTLRTPEPVTGVANHGDSCVELDLKVWCRTENYWTLKYYLEENVKIAFDEAGISIPYPQMDIHVKKR